LETLCTIGYTKSSLEGFIGRLRAAGVDAVIDIRLNNTSQLAGFSKKDDLAYLLREGFGIDYVHLEEMAPSPEVLDAFKKSKDWNAYESGYRKLIDKRDMAAKLVATVEKHGWESPCLLCAEPTSEHCHRRLLAEAVQRNVDGLEVIHL